MSKKLFITGTSTDVGKTYITGLIIKKLNEGMKKVAYYKAAMSGNKRGKNGILIPGDALYVKTISGIEQELDSMCPYIYESAVSPHLASRIENDFVKMEVVEKGFYNVCSKFDYVTIEGSGGIVCPICFEKEKIKLEDIIKKFNLGCLIIADAGLGTINNVVLTVEYMKSKNILIKGIILNHFKYGDIMHEDNLKMCEYLTGVKVLACVKDGDEEIDMCTDFLESLYE